MSSTADVRTRADAIKFLTVPLTASGRIEDFLNSNIARPDGPEERVRQYYARVLVEEYGYSRDCMRFEAPINIGSTSYPADIVIYDNPAAAAGKVQGQIALVVETKAPNKVEGKNQLASYVMASSARGGIWFNGEEVAYFRRIEQPNPHLMEWTNIPRRNESWDAVGHYRKSDLRPPHDLKTVFQRCHNVIYKSGLDSEDIAMDMVKIILAKYRDERNEGDLCEFRCTPEEFQDAAGQRAVANRVRILFADVASDHLDVFPNLDRISINDSNLASVVNELQPFRFLADEETEQVYDIIGTAFEIYVAAHLKGGRGQYFTNRLCVNMMIEVIDPSERDVIYDPSCGSGGFLIAALRHMRNKILRSSRSATAKQQTIRSASERLIGTDIAPRLVRVAKANMILNGDGHGGIAKANSLQLPEHELPVGFPLRADAEKRLTPTVILTNPPFGASHELRERNRAILENFDLGHIWELEEDGWLRQTDQLNDTEGVPPEILFLEKCVTSIAPGGRIGIVLARGVLDNRDALAARQYLLKHTKILGVVNCHPNTFAPFNGTKAAILFLEKKLTPGFARDENYPVFMAISQKVGQDSMGREIYRTNPNGERIIENGAPVIDHDLNDIVESWRSFTRGRGATYESSWSVPLARLIGSPEMRMNPTRFAPTAEKALSYVLELADSPEWQVERLGDFATVFNGPRFKRPFADEGAVGEHIVKMYTPKAFFEERGESVKLLDTNKANRTQLRALEVLTLERDWIMIVDSGTAGKLLGRVGITTEVHDGSIGNNNIIRVVINDPIRRDYVYQFLRSSVGQALLLRNVYGTNQDHIEPDDVKDIPIPLPREQDRLEEIHEKVRRVNALREEAARLDREASDDLSTIFNKLMEESGITDADVPLVAEPTGSEASSNPEV